jgi:hypothetical protein
MPSSITDRCRRSSLSWREGGDLPVPSIGDADAAAAQFALPSGWDKRQLLWLVDSLYENPAGYQLPRIWNQRPNWDKDRILRGISRATWGKNCPPTKFLGFPEQWEGLPCDLVREMFLNGGLPQSPFDKKGTVAWLDGLAWAHRTRYRDRTLWRDPVHWLWLSTPDSWPLRQRTQYLPRTAYVCLWLLNTARSKAWSKERIAHGPGGQAHTFTYIDLIDEIWDADIPTIKSSVEKVFERVNERISQCTLDRLARENRPVAPLPSHWPALLPGMRHLDKGGDLVAEGQYMQHCVGGYVEAAQRGECYIISIQTAAGRSTAELSPSRGVVQHRGIKNSAPARANEELLQRWLQRSA